MLYSTVPVELMDAMKLLFVFPLCYICNLALSYACMLYCNTGSSMQYIWHVVLFLILHLVLCVLDIDPGTSTECTETPVCDGPGRYTRQPLAGSSPCQPCPQRQDSQTLQPPLKPEWQFQAKQLS